MPIRIVRDQDGGVLVETTIMLTIIFVFVLGGIDFLFAFYQWTAAAKALQLGARIAAVSDPVVSGLSGLSMAALSSQNAGTSPLPFFSVQCDGSTGTCACTGTCPGMGTTVDTTAMKKLVYGRTSTSATTSCPNVTGSYNAGMCHIFSRVTPANVVVTYTDTGLGFAGRPTGPVPTVDVSLKNINFQFFFLGNLLGFGNRAIMSGLTTSTTGEDLSSSGP